MSEEGTATVEDGSVTRDDVIRVLAIKGYVTADLLAPALGVSSDEAADLLDRLVADGIATGSSGMFSLSADGKALGAEMLALRPRGLGCHERGRGPRWLRGPRRPHEDDRHRLADEGAWTGSRSSTTTLTPPTMRRSWPSWQRCTPMPRPGSGRWWGSCPRLARYAHRLDAAAAAVAAGDGRYIASPRVDSYHGVWFELHEDLIRLAGRTREDEVAAGRA